MGQTLFKSGPVVFKSAGICLLKVGRVVFYSRASCLLKWGELSSESGASCLGASFMWGELSWGELSLGRVVLIPPKSPVRFNRLPRCESDQSHALWTLINGAKLKTSEPI